MRKKVEVSGTTLLALNETFHQENDPFSGYVSFDDLDPDVVNHIRSDDKITLEYGYTDGNFVAVGFYLPRPKDPPFFIDGVGPLYKGYLLPVKKKKWRQLCRSADSL